MDLLHKQFIFAVLAARLILFASQRGFSVTFGETWRPDETAKIYAEQGRGVRNSVHRLRLAIDLNLYEGHEYLTDSARYQELGDFWESLSDPKEGIRCVWGGHFKTPDGCHFSIEHNGVC